MTFFDVLCDPTVLELCTIFGLKCPSFNRFYSRQIPASITLFYIQLNIMEMCFHDIDVCMCLRGIRRMKNVSYDYALYQ